jgi:hypothetical protein
MTSSFLFCWGAFDGALRSCLRSRAGEFTYRLGLLLQLIPARA